MIYAANFKTNHTRASTHAYVEKLNSALSAKKPEDKVYIFPPTTAFDHYEGDFTIGVQNAHEAYNGAFTGEIGVEQLDEFGIRTIMIGHSERRGILRKSQDQVIEKFSYFEKEGFEILYCIGEPLSIRDIGEDAVYRYLKAQLNGIDISYEKLIVAYEPIWAIGTGRSATVKEITTVHKELKAMINRPLLYGGSVNLKNIDEIRSIEEVDGVLIGSASLDAENFSKMILGS